MNGMDELQRELRRRQNRYRNMPYNAARVAANLDFLALADRSGSPRDRLTARYDLAWAYAVGDDPVKALPVCAEFFRLWEEHPDAIQGSAEGPSAAMIAFFVACSSPQIPLEQCRDLLELFHRQVKKFGLGERLWQMHACGFCLMTGDTAGAAEHFDRFRDTPRDDISDCAACEASNAAEYLLEMGRYEEAMEFVQPVLDRRLTCEQQPWDILAVLIHDALDRKDIAAAQGFGRRMFLHRIQRPGDMPCAGALMRLEAAAGGGQWASPGELEKCLSWALDLWDQKLLFRFYLGAGSFCGYLGEKQGEVRLSLPTRFPIYREDGIYSCQALVRWCCDQAADIARRFDARNGTNGYADALARMKSTMTGGDKE